MARAFSPSPATQPGFNKGRVPRNKGKKHPTDVLTREEYKVLLAAFSRTSGIGRRNRALIALMFHTGVKIGQLLRMEGRHYVPGSNTLTVPAGARTGERTVGVPVEARRELESWVEVRGRYGFAASAPLFCTLRGTSLSPSYVRTVLPREARRAGIAKAVTAETLRRSFQRQRVGEPPNRIERHVESYVDSPGFRERYPVAFESWQTAFESYCEDPVRHAQSIARACRKALTSFDEEATRHYELDVPSDELGRAKRLRAAIAADDAHLAPGMLEFLDALLKYWETTGDLVERHTDGEPVDVDEESTVDVIRRMVFHTMLAMYEIDQALRELS
jgi:hypothetical protein